MKNGEQVAAFERELADYCGAKHCVAAANGTVTLSAALIALGVKPGDRVAVPPLTMSATTIAALNVGAAPMFVDVDAETWLMYGDPKSPWWNEVSACIPVSLYGLWADEWDYPGRRINIDDAAQTLRKHEDFVFTSLSFQASKILALGEGGALLTDDEELAEKARCYLSLGYKMGGRARIDPASLKHPDFARHHSYPAINGRMSDLIAGQALSYMRDSMELPIPGYSNQMRWFGCSLDGLKQLRRDAASLYRDAITGCDWLTPQHTPEGWTHDYWCYAVAADTPERALKLLDAVERHGGERPYPAWALTFSEPAFRHLDPGLDACPVARSLQPRLVQFQTNNLAFAERNAAALRKAIKELS